MLGAFRFIFVDGSSFLTNHPKNLSSIDPYHNPPTILPFNLHSHMGCVLSFRKSAAGEDDDDLLVSVCRERKRLMKSAVDRRYALAGAHCKYNQSLYAVALALRLFVARHSSSPSSRFLITFPEPSTNLHLTQSKPAVVPAPVTKADEEEEAEEEEEEESNGSVCEHFYDDGTVDPTPPVMTSSTPGQQNQDEFGGWDFFNPFNNLMVNEDVQKPKAEDVKVTVADAKVTLNVFDAPPSLANEDDNGRELLDALKDVEDHFLKAYESGVEFSKMLEFSNVGPLDHLHLKESSEKFIPSIAWHKSTITRSPSCRSLLSCSSRSSSTWTGINSTSDIFEETGGMESGSHLSTLGRLYAWEKKLYDEVKAGNETKKLYDRKSLQLNGDNGSNKHGIEEQVNDLYSRMLVSIKICNSISKRIEKVRDDELQPQLLELLHGLTKTWKSMLESHKIQSRTMFKVKSFSTSPLTNDPSRHLATLQLEAEIQNWQSSFSTYITSIKSYVESLTEWSNRTLIPEPEPTTPPLVFTICRNWLTVTKTLPDKAVTYAMKRFSKDLRALWAQQGLEQQQQQKVDRIVAEMEKRVVGFEREERSIINTKGFNVKNKVDDLGEKKAKLDSFRKMVEIEKGRHKDCVEETRRVILVGFQTGFSSVFDSLTEFCEVCVRKYDDVARIGASGSYLIHGS
ncbi:hypothetical protein LXL04_007330 [Taraxacum kok-saghyz]